MEDEHKKTDDELAEEGKDVTGEKVEEEDTPEVEV